MFTHLPFPGVVPIFGYLIVPTTSRRFRSVTFSIALTLFILLPPPISGAAIFKCPSGDVACLISAISTANATGEADTIKLAAGIYTLTGADNFTDGPNGLPSIASRITIEGKGADETVIRRDPLLGEFGELRIIHINETGHLTLDAIAIKGGLAVGNDLFDGAGVFNRGTATLKRSIVSENFAHFGTGGIQNLGGRMSVTDSLITDNTGIDGAHGGAINNRSGGTFEIRRSTIANNCGETSGGIGNEQDGNVTIRNSVIVGNGGGATAGGISNAAIMTIINSTIANNASDANCPGPPTPAARTLSLELFSGGAGINNSGRITVKSSTIAHNFFDNVFSTDVGGGILNFPEGTVELQNTIVALNGFGFPGPDCAGVIISLGNNLIGDTTDCDIVLHPSDLTGDPGLDEFTDDGTPGNGHFPLLANSQAINAGDDESCPKRDQIGNKRKGPCDIGAIEFRRRPIRVILDIDPGDKRNRINPERDEFIDVAILGSHHFDASTVDPSTVRFGPNKADGDGHLERVNHDRKLDLLIRFKLDETGIFCGDKIVSLIGETFDGDKIVGSGSIKTKGCKKK